MAGKEDDQQDKTWLERAIEEEVKRERERSQRIREAEERRRRGEE